MGFWLSCLLTTFPFLGRMQGWRMVFQLWVWSLMTLSNGCSYATSLPQSASLRRLWKNSVPFYSVYHSLLWTINRRLQRLGRVWPLVLVKGTLTFLLCTMTFPLSPGSTTHHYLPWVHCGFVHGDRKEKAAQRDSRTAEAHLWGKFSEFLSSTETSSPSSSIRSEFFNSKPQSSIWRVKRNLVPFLWGEKCISVSTLPHSIVFHT